MKTKIKTDYGTFSVLPCPFCGNQKLYLGHRDSMSMEVRCFYVSKNYNFQGCGASVARELFPDDEIDEFPNDEIDDNDYSTVKPPKNAFKKKWFEKRALRKSVKKWNERV